MTNPPRNFSLESGPRDDDERMVRYIVGECSAPESARTQEWIAADPARWQRFRELERVWRASGTRPSRRWDAEGALVELRAALGSRGEREVDHGEAQRVENREPRRAPMAPLTLGGSRDAERGAWSRGVARLAAALVLIVAGAVGWRAIAGRWPVSTGNDADAVVPMQAVSTARGQRATITLSDGSRIVLGAESSVKYARDFGARAHRDVYLDGQAFFEVAHDSLRPFAVHTSRGVAEDLGTEFVVTAYPGAPAMQVVVASGKVLLRGAASSGPDSSTTRAVDDHRLTLGPGELGTVDSSGVLSRSRVTDVSQYLDWTRGELVFRGVPLRDALPAIGRWYDMEIALGDTSLGSRRLVASFGPHSAGDVVRLIALAVDARYVERGDTVVLLPRRAGRR